MREAGEDPGQHDVSGVRRLAACRAHLRLRRDDFGCSGEGCPERVHPCPWSYVYPSASASTARLSACSLSIARSRHVSSTSWSAGVRVRPSRSDGDCGDGRTVGRLPRCEVDPTMSQCGCRRSGVYGASRSRNTHRQTTTATARHHPMICDGVTCRRRFRGSARRSAAADPASAGCRVARSGRAAARVRSCS